jgi:type I restriction enzyme, S subunit
MGVEVVQLGDICDFAYGDGLIEAERQGGLFPVYGSNGIVGWHDQALTTGPTIVIGRKGSIGEIHLSHGPCWPIDTTYYVESTKQPSVLTWLYYMLLALDLTQLNKSAAVPGLNRNDAYEKRVPFPSLPEQQRIAAILARADRLRRLRRHALELSEGYLQAVFVEMFHRNTAPDWPVIRVADLAKRGANAIRTGPFGSQLLHSEFVSEGIAVLGIDNAVNNRFTWGKPRFITEQKYRLLKRYTVLPGDVIITIMGTIGRCAVVPDSIPPAINTKHLCCISLNQQLCLPIFLQWCFLAHPQVQQQLGLSEKGAIMPGLNMEIIKDLRFSLPPMELQQQFAFIADRHERLRAQQREALRQAEQLFGSLLDRAFRGEL